MKGFISTRQICAKDIDFLRKVYSSTREQELALARGWDESQKESFIAFQFEAQDIHYRKHYKDASFQIIQYNGEDVGRLYIFESTAEIRIIDIALLREFRGQGIGSILLKEILSKAENSRRAVRIHVETDNPAMTWYKNLGFRLIEDKGFYKFLEWKKYENNN